MKITTISLLIILCFSVSGFTQSGLSIQTGLYREKKTSPAAHPKSNDNNVYKIWIGFTDKGVFDTSTYARQLLEEDKSNPDRTQIRRQKNNYKTSFADLPLCETYIQAIEQMGAVVRSRSRWFNAVGVEANLATLEKISELPFVSTLQTIPTYIRPLPGNEESAHQPPFAKSLDFYGYARKQLETVNVIPLLESGLSGKGVRVGVLDGGFDTDLHQAFSKLQLIAEYDFIFNDDEPGDEEGQDVPFAADHGSAVVSIIAGYDPNQFIGPAHDAEFLLAKTEWAEFEVRVEEDAWVEALEWMEQMGVDLITASLGYLNFDDGFTYLPEDMNGQTGITTIASQAAFERGVVMIVSAGNSGLGGQQIGSIDTPGDGKDVIAVGAIDWDGERSDFSSTGPTADGRIKPDVMALGSDVRFVDYITTSGYAYGSGTSFSSPMVAAVAALLMESHPDWTAVDIREALLTTASQAETPDNLYGYGIVNAELANRYNAKSFVTEWDFFR